eukprot:1590326-Pyramimonas_sp.AAC.1
MKSKFPPRAQRTGTLSIHITSSCVAMVHDDHTARQLRCRLLLRGRSSMDSFRPTLFCQSLLQHSYVLATALRSNRPGWRVRHVDSVARVQFESARASFCAQVFDHARNNPGSSGQQ